MSPLKYGLLAFVLVAAGALIFLTPAKESINGWKAEELSPETETVLPPDSSNKAFSTSPASGAAPLQVVFFYPSQPGSLERYSVDFGDGKSAPMSQSCGAEECTLQWSTAHIYTAPGAYYAKLYGNSPVDGQCNAAQNPDCGVIASVAITVSNAAPTSCTTPWGNLTVQNGQAVMDEPYFSDGMCEYPGVNHPWSPQDNYARHVCQSGQWVVQGTCHDGGPTCMGSWDACASKTAGQ